MILLTMPSHLGKKLSRQGKIKSYCCNTVTISKHNQKKHGQLESKLGLENLIALLTLRDSSLSPCNCKSKVLPLHHHMTLQLQIVRFEPPEVKRVFIAFVAGDIACFSVYRSRYCPVSDGQKTETNRTGLKTPLGYGHIDALSDVFHASS